MRRTITTFALTVSVFALTILPAFAAEEEAAGSGEINGILFALIAGSIIGIVLFLDAYRGDTGPSEHHGDTAGH